MLFEKQRHPDRNIYTHPGSRGMDNPSILVPDFIERRYDDMAEERSRDGVSNSLKSQMRLSFNNNNKCEFKSPTMTTSNLPPILESDHLIRSTNTANSFQQIPNTEDEKTDNSMKNDLGASGALSINPGMINSSLKHPLKHSWTFWYFNMNLDSENWDEKLLKVVDVNTVEDFWSVYHHMEDVSRIESGCDYALFKVSFLIYI